MDCDNLLVISAISVQLKTQLDTAIPLFGNLSLKTKLLVHDDLHTYIVCALSNSIY